MFGVISIFMTCKILELFCYCKQKKKIFGVKRKIEF